MFAIAACSIFLIGIMVLFFLDPKHRKSTHQ